MRNRWRTSRATSSPRSSSGDEAVPLCDLDAGQRGVVTELAAGRTLTSRMASLGFTPGAEVTVVQNFGRGALIARVRDTRIALGRGEARRIRVRLSAEE
jgi:Fe2+ transport system protein FeoA